MKRTTLLFCCLLSAAINLLSQQGDFPRLTGPYLGQKPPGTVPELFAPGIISKGYDERMCFFTPDGRECFFQMRGAPHAVVIHLKEIGGAWADPEVAFFSGKYFSEFALSPDGDRRPAVLVPGRVHPLRGQQENRARSVDRLLDALRSMSAAV